MTHGMEHLFYDDWPFCEVVPVGGGARSGTESVVGFSQDKRGHMIPLDAGDTDCSHRPTGEALAHPTHPSCDSGEVMVQRG